MVERTFGGKPAFITPEAAVASPAGSGVTAGRAGPLRWSRGRMGSMAERLRGATSPYLLQHADNPVDWWPWGDEAFAAAAELGVPVLLSVGYSACHWCHVMAHESFENEQTAALMNEHMVC